MLGPNPVRTIAVIEGLKGVVVIAAGLGVLSLIHKNVQEVAEQIVGRLHLDAAKDLPRIFLEYSAQLNDKRLGILAGLALIYATGRLIEAYGLWYERTWAEWFAVITAGIYIPFEILEIAEGKGPIAMIALSVNILIVSVMLRALKQGTRTSE